MTSLGAGVDGSHGVGVGEPGPHLPPPSVTSWPGSVTSLRVTSLGAGVDGSHGVGVREPGPDLLGALVGLGRRLRQVAVTVSLRHRHREGRGLLSDQGS